MATLYAGDFETSDAFEFGSHTVTEDEIVRFGEEFDPQPFHVDPEAAADSMFGGLVASGWHVVSITNRLLCESVYGRTALLGGKGSEHVTFHRPTRPGDTLSGVAEVASVEDPKHRPDCRTVDFAVTTASA